MTIPFMYPTDPHQRRHGPAGYAAYESFRPWLRDEFAFRCVYCLSRETWGPLGGQYAIDHFVPAALAPNQKTEYTNLLYSCVTCNGVKGNRRVPNPLTVFLNGSIRVEPDGALHSETTEVAQLIELLDLNDPRRLEYRALWISVLNLARRFDAELHRRLLGYPADLPDRATLKPPGGNIRPNGIVESHFARRKRDELPETY